MFDKLRRLLNPPGVALYRPWGGAKLRSAGDAVIKSSVPAPGPTEDPRDCVMVVGLGAMKSGTSWLGAYLAETPGFLFSPVKEMSCFNMFADNPFRSRDVVFRIGRMDDIILRPKGLDLPQTRDRLRALAQIGRINDAAAYLDYFAERLSGHTHFGEISPAYSHLPVETLKLIAGLTRDVRFLFLMRDPALRAASQIRHARRTAPEVSIDDHLATLNRGKALWLKGDYGYTLDRLEEAGMTARTRFMTYEALLTEENLRGLCDWLGLPFHTPKVDKILNPGRGEDLTQAQHDQLRERLDPIYVDLARRDLPPGAETWRWT